MLAHDGSRKSIKCSDQSWMFPRSRHLLHTRTQRDAWATSVFHRLWSIRCLVIPGCSLGGSRAYLRHLHLTSACCHPGNACMATRTCWAGENFPWNFVLWRQEPNLPWQRWPQLLEPALLPVSQSESAGAMSWLWAKIDAKLEGAFRAFCFLAGKAEKDEQGSGRASCSLGSSWLLLCLALHRGSITPLPTASPLKPAPKPTCRCGTISSTKRLRMGYDRPTPWDGWSSGRWQQQGCLEVGMGPDWRWVGWEPSTELFPALGRSCHLRAPGSWLEAISRLVPVNYRAPGSLPYLGFCRSQGLKLSRSLGKPFPLLK